MKKFSIPFLILITFCSSGAENTEPQDTSNNEQSQEIAQNEEFEVFSVDLGYDIYELYSCLDAKGLRGLPEPEINTSEIVVRFDDGYDEAFFELFYALIPECEEEREKDKVYAQEEDNTDSENENNNSVDVVLEDKVYSWDQPENIDWIEYNFNTSDTFCDDVDGYCAGWQENASQECKDNYKLGSTEEDVQKRSTYERCVYQNDLQAIHLLSNRQNNHTTNARTKKKR